ncbi:MAG: hypothetical protein QWI36_04920, partial [Wolbachia endosymbiont of Tyrophagus putrescentiae]|nr:hypothetical protein [Wolbachia endosymbiont of Tyrophagus putrescentiae]
MKIRLFFFLSLLILSINVYCSCEDIAENIEACKAYTCSRYIGGENYIKHKILGLDSKNLCIYIEKHNNDEMICHHSEQGRIAEKKYFENIVNQETDNFTDIVRVRSQECFFVNSNNLNYMDQEDVIREATDNDLETLSQ